MSFFSRHKRTISLTVFFSLLFLVCELAEARIGGSGGFSGGRSSGGSGGSSGGDGGYLFYILIRFAIEYPLLGVPLLIGVVYFFYKSGQKGKSQYTGHIIRKGLSVKSKKLLAEDIRRICLRDRNFNPTIFENRVKNSFYKMQELWSEGRITEIRPFVSDGTFERFSILGRMYAENKLRNVIKDLEILSCSIADVESSPHFDTLHVKITAKAVDYFVDAENGRKVSGSKKPEIFTEYWSFLRRPGAKTLHNSGLLEGFCPNCGTLLKISDKTKCGSCQAVITSGEYDWVLSEITQAVNWVPPIAKAIKGLGHLQLKDPAFNEQFIEDRVSTIFWTMRYSEFTGNKKFLERYAQKSLIDELEIGLEPDQSRTFYADPAVGSVELVEVISGGKGDDFDRVRVKIVWSAHKETEKISRRILPDYDQSVVYSREYILKRHKNVLTPAGSSLLSMHCPNCGAPATEKTGSECEYCSTSFVDGRRDWVLEKVGRFSGYPQQYHEVRIGAAVKVPEKSLTGMNAENLLSAVITVMLADDVIDAKERVALEKLARRLSYPIRSLDRLINGVKSNGFQADIPQNPQASRQFVVELTRMALADGNICRRELNLIKTVSAKIGYIDADVDMLVKRVRRDLYEEARAALHPNKY